MFKRILVPLDGSILAEAVIESAARLIAALAAPAQGALHLLRVVKPPVVDKKKDNQEDIDRMKKHELHETKIYLDFIACHLREGTLADLHLSITWSVVLDDDPAGTIIRVAENGEDAEGVGVFGRCELIAMATHGRSGWQHH